mmetsp:Transcript_60184/g.167922  ORF Transcript_60184/g.167922 Transcript_60184/m.167922 type:complete len:257 (+) Transcript_60184:1613-2383(+)
MRVGIDHPKPAPLDPLVPFALRAVESLAEGVRGKPRPGAATLQRYVHQMVEMRDGGRVVVNVFRPRPVKGAVWGGIFPDRPCFEKLLRAILRTRYRALWCVIMLGVGEFVCLPNWRQGRARRGEAQIRETHANVQQRQLLVERLQRLVDHVVYMRQTLIRWTAGKCCRRCGTIDPRVLRNAGDVAGRAARDARARSQSHAEQISDAAHMSNCRLAPAGKCRIGRWGAVHAALGLQIHRGGICLEKQFVLLQDPFLQ